MSRAQLRAKRHGEHCGVDMLVSNSYSIMFVNGPSQNLFYNHTSRYIVRFHYWALNSGTHLITFGAQAIRLTHNLYCV